MTSPTGIIQAVLVKTPGTRSLVKVLDRGPQGPPGGGAGASYEFIQATPAASWSIPVTGFARKPSVAIYDATGEQVYTTVISTPMLVTVVFPGPATGSVVLT